MSTHELIGRVQDFLSAAIMAEQEGCELDTRVALVDLLNLLKDELDD